MNSIISEGKNPVLTEMESIYIKKDSNYINILKKAMLSNRLKYISLGALKKDKLVGWLNENESKGYNYIIENMI